LSNTNNVLPSDQNANKKRTYQEFLSSPSSSEQSLLIFDRNNIKQRRLNAPQPGQGHQRHPDEEEKVDPKT